MRAADLRQQVRATLASTVSDFRTAAGLFPGNTGQFVLSGTLTDTTGVTTGMAAAGPAGVPARLPQVVVPDAANKIDLLGVLGGQPALLRCQPLKEMI